MSKFFTVFFLIFFTLNACTVEAKASRGSSRSSGRSHSVRSAKQQPKVVKRTTTVKREDPTPAASGSGMAQAIIGSAVGATVGTVVGNAISDVIKGDSDQEDELTDAEKESM